jgi:hypothetical protein
MLFSQFIKNSYGEQEYVFGHRISVSEGTVFIDGDKTDFTSLEEARQYIKQENIAKQLEEEVTAELYEELSDIKIAEIIRDTHNIKVTDTLVENYKNLASSNIFTIDLAVQKIRKLNKLDNIVEGKVHWVLEDGSTVAIDKRTQKELNSLLDNHDDVIDYMRESKENFLKTLQLLGK